MANDEKIGVTEQSYSSSSEVKKRTTKRPSSSSSKRKIKSGDKTANNTKAESWSSTSTASENYNYSTLFVPPTTLQSEEHEAPVPPPVAVLKKSGIKFHRNHLKLSTTRQTPSFRWHTANVLKVHSFVRICLWKIRTCLMIRISCLILKMLNIPPNTRFQFRRWIWILCRQDMGGPQ